MASGGFTARPAIIVIADPQCEHCDALIDEVTAAWRSRTRRTSPLAIIYDRALRGGIQHGLAAAEPGLFIFVDSTGALLHGLPLAFVPALIALDDHGQIVARIDGAVSADSVHAFMRAEHFVQ